MRRRTILIIVSAVVTAAAIAAVVFWATAEPYSETLAKCKTALAAQTKAGVKGKPSACEDVKEDDYSEIIVSNALDGMSKKERDTLDYFDNGTIDGSIG
jgi:flagellar basal body-associated protein FliL